MRIGYGRVSTRDQNPAAQRDALAAAGCAQVFIDKASGKLASRPELDKALMVARPGDQLVVTKLDRLGRSLGHLISLSKGLQERGVGPGGARPGHRHLHRRGPDVLPDPRRDRRV
jgi:DNA invertase Pin-like site-specific DNA recombinase